MTWVEMFMMGWLAGTMSLGAYQGSRGMYISLLYTSMATFTAHENPSCSKRFTLVDRQQGLYPNSTISRQRRSLQKIQVPSTATTSTIRGIPPLTIAGQP